MHKQKRVFEVTRGKIWLALLIAALALTAVFEIGVLIGTKRTITAQQKAMRRGDARMRLDARASTEVKPPLTQSTGQSMTEKGETQYAVQVSTFCTRKNAEEMVRSLESYEYKPWIREESRTEQTLYSVLIGNFNTKEEAQQFGMAISERLSFIPGYMAREIGKEDIERMETKNGFQGKNSHSIETQRTR